MGTRQSLENVDTTLSLDEPSPSAVSMNSESLALARSSGDVVALDIDPASVSPHVVAGDSTRNGDSSPSSTETDEEPDLEHPGESAGGEEGAPSALPLFFGQVLENFAQDEEDEYWGFPSAAPSSEAVHPLTT